MSKSPGRKYLILYQNIKFVRIVFGGQWTGGLISAGLNVKKMESIRFIRWIGMDIYEIISLGSINRNCIKCLYPR